MKKLCLLLILFSFSVLSATTDTKIEDQNAPKETNESLKDPRVGKQYIPIIKSNVGDSVSYSFIDRNAVTLHPYNKNIRVFTETINYGPALFQEKEDGEKIPYRSIVIQQFVNCDQMEVAKGQVQVFEQYFGEGELRNTDNRPKRWEPTGKGSEQRRLILVACALPLNNQ